MLSYSANANSICCHAIGNRSGDTSAMQNQPQKSFIDCHSYQDTQDRKRLNCHVPWSHFRSCWGRLLILWLHIHYVSTNCTAKNLVGYCRAVHCIQGSVVVPCVHTRQENREGRVRSRVVGKVAVQHSVPISTVCIFGEG